MAALPPPPQRKKIPGEEKTVYERMRYISANTEYVLGMAELKSKMDRGKAMRGYWGIAPIKNPSIEIIIPLIKVRDLINAGFQMTVLIADLHAFLDKGSHWIDRTDERVSYHIMLIKAVLLAFGINENQYEIVRGRDYQLDKQYILDVFKMMTYVTVNQSIRAGSEIIRQKNDPYISSLLYPIMQAVDETVMDADVEIGGTDQLKIFSLARNKITYLGYEKCSYVVTELLSSLQPMNKPSLRILGYINFTDSKEAIWRKLKLSPCEEGESKDNACLELARLIVYPAGKKLKSFDTYYELEVEWEKGVIYALELKSWLTDVLDEIIDPVRRVVYNNIHMYNNAYTNVEVTCKKN